MKQELTNDQISRLMSIAKEMSGEINYIANPEYVCINLYKLLEDVISEYQSSVKFKNIQIKVLTKIEKEKNDNGRKNKVCNNAKLSTLRKSNSNRVRNTDSKRN